MCIYIYIYIYVIIYIICTYIQNNIFIHHTCTPVCMCVCVDNIQALRESQTMPNIVMEDHGRCFITSAGLLRPRLQLPRRWAAGYADGAQMVQSAVLVFVMEMQNEIDLHRRWSKYIYIYIKVQNKAFKILQNLCAFRWSLYLGHLGRSIFYNVGPPR